MNCSSLLWSLSLPLLLVIGGCSYLASKPLGEELNPWVGRPATATFARLGMPDSEGKVADRKFYLWEHDAIDSITIDGSPNVYSLHCKVRAFVDDDDIVRYFDVQGNIGGCRYYR